MPTFGDHLFSFPMAGARRGTFHPARSLLSIDSFVAPVEYPQYPSAGSQWSTDMLSVIDRFIPNRYGRLDTMSAIRSARATLRQMPRYRRVFPDFGELDVVIPAGFEDSSSVDDGMPSFTNETLRALLMVDYVDPKQRLGPEAPRFAVFDLDELKRLSPDALLFETDDYRQALCFIDRLR